MQNARLIPPRTRRRRVKSTALTALLIAGCAGGLAGCANTSSGPREPAQAPASAQAPLSSATETRGSRTMAFALSSQPPRLASARWTVTR